MSKDNDKTMLEQLHAVNEVFFSVFGPNINTYFNPLFKGKSSRQAALNVAEYADSLNAWFMENRMYDSLQEEMERLKPALPDMTSAICSCISAGLKFKDSIPPGTDLTQFTSCYSSYASDYKLVLKIRLAFAGYSTARAMKTSGIAGTYALLHCKPMYVYLKNNLVNTAVEQFVAGRQYFIEGLPRMLQQLYTRKKTDSLVTYFPAYQKYTAQLNDLSKQKEDWQKRDTASIADTLIFAGTYTTGNYDNRHITGQVKMYLSNDAAPIVYRLEYLDRTKIPNVAALEKEIKKTDIIIPPPPPPKERVPNKQ